jgi:peptidoglycan/xylan/chitin deacetylase (PgdA/CDA1 family)
MKALLLILASVFAIFLGIRVLSGLWKSRVSWKDITTFYANPQPIGRLDGDPLKRLGLRSPALREPVNFGKIRYVQKSRYLNNARAVVTHSIDDSTRYILDSLDAMDKYDIKASIFVSTEVEPISQLWPRLRQAVANGHEIGSHSRRHQCRRPYTFLFCFLAYTGYEISGSRDDILSHTNQPHVWSWCYPCGQCAGFDFVHRKLARGGYLVARNYPGENQDRHIVPDLQTYDPNPYNASYTQVVQKKGGTARSGRTDVAELNAKFDEVYQRGGIYNFLSHPAWLDYGPDKFYERHLAYVGRRSDVWYVPMGPLYAYRTVVERTEIRQLEPTDGTERFAVYNDLDPKIFNTSITLEFFVPEDVSILTYGKPLLESRRQLTIRWNSEYFRRQGDSVFVTIRPNTVLEFR